MNVAERIALIEGLIAADPGGRDVFELVLADQLRLAAESLRSAGRVGIVSGFHIPQVGASETDGPPGAKVIGRALRQLGVVVDYITDRHSALLFVSLGIEPLVEPWSYLDDADPTHLVAVERLGRCMDGCYRNMRGVDVSATTEPLDELFLEARRRDIVTIGIGDGGNEIGMGKVFVRRPNSIDHGLRIVTTISTDYCIAAGVSNWGAYGLAGALSLLSGRDLIPSSDDVTADIRDCVEHGGAVDGVTHRREPTVDGLDLSHSLRILEQIRCQVG